MVSGGLKPTNAVACAQSAGAGPALAATRWLLQAREVMRNGSPIRILSLAPTDSGKRRMQIYASRLSLLIFIALMTGLAGVIPARPHTYVDPDGQQISWYPMECCHGRDCRPVATIKSAPQGLWMTTVDGQTVLVGPHDRRRASQDQRWHVCVGPGEMDDSGPQIYCIFEPPNS